MLSFFDPLRGMGFGAVLFRMILACLCGALIGLERSYKNKSAGFRTHILVCLGACIASLTGLYLYLVVHLPTDMSRIGAQVITGLGFIGGGTIIVTRDKTVRGLTTAAGMWASGIIGLAVGAGFYEGALSALVIILFIETVMDRFRSHIRKAPEFRVAVSYYTRPDLDNILRYFKDRNCSITNLQITGSTEGAVPVYSALVSLRSGYELSPEVLLTHIRSMEGIISAEKI